MTISRSSNLFSLSVKASQSIASNFSRRQRSDVKKLARTAASTSSFVSWLLIVLLLSSPSPAPLDTSYKLDSYIPQIGATRNARCRLLPKIHAAQKQLRPPPRAGEAESLSP